MELDILYEDDALMVVNKPAGVVVHPTYRNPSGTLLDALRAHASDWHDSQNPSLVGRLDKDTSGIVVVAKTAAHHATLQRIHQSPDCLKDYIAVVRGVVNVERGTISDSLRVDPSDRRRVIVSPTTDGGVASETRFERLEHTAEATLLRCRLITGRRHQIRVHLAARGWPIIGDRVYGNAIDPFPRQALHAWQAAFAHPVSGQRIRVEAPLPPELHALLLALHIPPAVLRHASLL
jgi:23S rRNA pseudouridine1911/1915/1917 synthase